jgi:tripartite-type tricarboxylate transporter receptor subunit TctC
MLGRGSMRTIVPLVLSGLLAMPGAVRAQGYPNANVRLIVPNPPGGVTDALARILAQGLTERWGQSVLVENRAGGSTAIGTVAVERAAPDGYTLLVTSDATFTANPHLTEKLTYSPKNLLAIAMLASITPMLVVNAELPVKNVKDLIEYTKARPGKLNYGSYGIGSYSHLSMEDFKQRSGTDVVHVPFGGASPAMVALLRGDIAMLLLNLSSIEAQEGDGKIRMIASAGTKRAPTRPEFPTVAESGVPGFMTGAWFALFGPAGLPADLVAKINADAGAALETKTAKDLFLKQSFGRENLSPKQMAEIVDRDSEHWGRLIKSLGIKPN